MEMMGSERVLFSADYPFESVAEAAEWIEAAPLTGPERRAVCHDNAAALLRL
jgi:2,3-dihydroxybenzoate decarboxylase